MLQATDYREQRVHNLFDYYHHTSTSVHQISCSVSALHRSARHPAEFIAKKMSKPIIKVLNQPLNIKH